MKTAAAAAAAAAAASPLSQSRPVYLLMFPSFQASVDLRLFLTALNFDKDKTEDLFL